MIFIIQLARRSHFRTKKIKILEIRKKTKQASERSGFSFISCPFSDPLPMIRLICYG